MSFSEADSVALDWKKVPQVCAAAFAVGLFLVGPQAAGIAVAEAPDESSASRSAGSADSSRAGAGRVSRAAPQPGAVSRGRTAGAGRAGGREVTRVPAAAGAAPSSSTSAGRARAGAAVAAEPSESRESSGVRSGVSRSGSVAVAAATAAPDPAAGGPVSEALVVAPIGAAESVIAEVGGDSAALLAPEWPSGLDSLMSVPKDLAPIVSPVFSAVDQVADQINSTVNVFLHRVGNWLAGLPDNNVTTFLEGALLLVRRTLFNQAPDVNPVQEVSTSELIRGSLGAVDPEADTLSYAVITAPEFGEVVVDEYGDYAYTPGAGYAGSDSFVVKVFTDRAGINLLDLFGDGSSVVTVLVGEGAATNSFMDAAPDPIDATLYLADVSGVIKLARASGLAGLAGQIAATVTLEGLDADEQVKSWDAEARKRDIDAGEILAPPGPNSYWDEFAEAAELSDRGVTLGVNFSLDGKQYTLILDNVRADVDTAGQYQLTGVLSSSPEWPVVGNAYKQPYQNFMDDFGRPPRADVPIKFGNAEVFIDTYSLLTFANQMVGDPGVSAEELGIGAPEPAAGLEVNSPEPVASVNYGRSFVMAFADGNVKEWTSDGWKTLQSPGVWKSPVKSMIDYGNGFVVGLENGSVQQWTGFQFGENQVFDAAGLGGCASVGRCTVSGLKMPLIAPYTGGQQVTWAAGDYIRMTDNKTDDVSGRPNIKLVQYNAFGVERAVVSANGHVQAMGDGIVYIGEGGTGYFLSTDPGFERPESGQLEVTIGQVDPQRQDLSGYLTNGWRDLKCGYCEDGWDSPVAAMLALQDSQGLDDRLVVGLADGSVQQWSNRDSQWTEFKGVGWNSAVVGMTARPAAEYQSGDLTFLGYVVLANGSVQRFNGIRTGEPPSWNELQGPRANDGASAVLAYKPFSDKSQLVVAYRGIGSASPSRAVSSWNFGDGTTSIDTPDAGPGWGQSVSTMVAYQDGIAIGLGTGDQPGAVQFWRPGVGWTELRGTDWNSAVEYMVVSDDGALTVGLDNGSVQQWDGNRWGQLKGGYSADAWNSEVVLMLADGFAGEAGNQVVVALRDGRVEKWVPVKAGAIEDGDWVELNPKTVPAFDKDRFERAAKSALAGEDPIGEASLFVEKAFLPAACSTLAECGGSFYRITTGTGSEPNSLASKTFDLGVNGQSLKLSYDLNYALAGYVYVPPGAWEKFKVSNYAGAFLLAMPTGPSLELDLAGSPDQPFSSGWKDLVSTSFYRPTSIGVFQVDAGVRARVEATLQFDEGFDKESLSAHFYYVPGMVTAFNTNGFSGIQVGFESYLDTEFSDFQQIKGVEIVPELEPYVVGTYGLLTPKKTPLIGQVDLASVNLGYQNPVTLNLALGRDKAPSLTLGSKGILTYGASILGFITDSLSFSGETTIYDKTGDAALDLWPTAV